MSAEKEEKVCFYIDFDHMLGATYLSVFYSGRLFTLIIDENNDTRELSITAWSLRAFKRRAGFPKERYKTQYKSWE